jgi:hypothetical protein
VVALEGVHNTVDALKRKAEEGVAGHDNDYHSQERPEKDPKQAPKIGFIAHQVRREAVESDDVPDLGE